MILSEERLIKSKGVTLMELIVVMIVIAILASIALPQMHKAVEKSRQAEAIEVLTKIYRGYKILVIEGNAIASPSWTDLGFDAAPTGKYFTYSYNVGAGIGRADRMGGLGYWVQIDLNSGNITKSAPY